MAKKQAMKGIATTFFFSIALTASAQSPRTTTSVSSVASWPQGDVLRRGDKVQVTTFDMSGVPFPCKVKTITADQLVCGKSRDAHLRAFDRTSVQSIVLDGHPRHKVSLIAYVASASLVIGGLASVLAGAPLPGVYLIYAGLGGFVVAGVAEHVEAYRGPTEAKSIYIATPATHDAPAAPNVQPAATQP